MSRFFFIAQPPYRSILRPVKRDPAARDRRQSASRSNTLRLPTAGRGTSNPRTSWNETNRHRRFVKVTPLVESFEASRRRAGALHGGAFLNAEPSGCRPTKAPGRGIAYLRFVIFVFANRPRISAAIRSATLPRARPRPGRRVRQGQQCPIRAGCGRRYHNPGEAGGRPRPPSVAS